MSTKVSVLVTGSAGRLGRAAVAELQRCGHAVRGFDLSPNARLEDQVLGSLLDRPALDHAMRGIECVVHLAATPDDDDFLESLLPNNITGLFHLVEAARTARVRRLVLASSGQVNWWQQRRGPYPIRTADPVSPKSWYAATKMFLESIGRTLAEVDGISTLTARLGWCPRTPEQVAEIAASPHFQDVYLSPGDAGSSPAASRRRMPCATPSCSPPAGRSSRQSSTCPTPSACSASRRRTAGRLGAVTSDASGVPVQAGPALAGQTSPRTFHGRTR